MPGMHVLLAMVLRKEYAAPPVDIGHVIRTLLVHDLVEIDAGDTYAYDERDIQEQNSEGEQAAARRIPAFLPGETGQKPVRVVGRI